MRMRDRAAMVCSASAAHALMRSAAPCRLPQQVYAKIDRPKGLVLFAQPKSPNTLLNDWSSDISSLLNMLEGTCHLIHKENMVHKIV
jgi:hypothetical protein